jgi:Holliday junction DNA helicase RuvB
MTMGWLKEFLARPLFTVTATVAQPDDIRVEGAGRSAGEEAIAPRSLSEFVGQEEVTRLLRAEVEAAKRTGRPLSHVLLYGPPGVGKTALAHVLAEEVGAVVHESSGAEFQTQVDVLLAFAAVGKRHEATGKPVLWLIDEVDAIPRVATYAMHSLLANGWVSFKGEKFGLVPLTVVGTTNHMALVPGALRDRFQVVAKLDFLSPQELAQVADGAGRRMGIRLTGEAADFIGMNGAGSPRQVTRRILPCLANILRGPGFATLEDARQAVALAGIRPGGLTKSQVDYLEFLSSAKDRTAGVGSLSAYLGEPRRDVEDLERFLIRRRAVSVTPRGRTVTDTGLRYLTEANI